MTKSHRLPLAVLSLAAIYAVLSACSEEDATEPDGGHFAVDLDPVRVFAVGNHQALDYATTYEDYVAEQRRLIEWIAPDFASDRHNLVVLGEDIGLVAAFIGSRGNRARQASTAAVAFAFIASRYQELTDYYQERYPDITLNRAVTLALTDTMARAFFSAFPPLADEYDIYLSACSLLPALRTSDDPNDIEQFGDPDLDAEAFVYLPVDENVYNTCFIWDPDGNEVGATRKVNLVSLEGPDFLDLSHGQLEQVEAFDLPFGRVAIAISLDAFIPEYVEHLDAMGAQIVLQNDANPGPWAHFQPRGSHITPSDGETLVWQPEEWEDSTIRMVQHGDTPHILFNVCPMMVGNLFDITFDGQSSVTARYPPEGTPARHYVGNPAQPSFVALGPWTFPDPVEADPEMTLEARRAALETLGDRLAAGSGDPVENEYTESYVWADIDVAAALARAGR